MSTIAQSARTRRLPSRDSSRRSGWALGGGVLWIVLFTVLLAGVVGVNVAVLRLNLERDRTSRDRVELRADISRLRAELSSAAATLRIERLAQKDLGMVPADPDRTTYVQLGR